MPDDFEISIRPPDDPDVEVVLKGARDDGDAVRLRASAVLFQGRRVAVGVDGLTVGRDSSCDLVLSSGLVSPHHARIERRGDGHVLTDLGSRTGTYLNGEPFSDAERALHGGDSIALGDEILHFVATRDTPFPPVVVPSALRMDRERLRLGRAPDNDIVLDHPNVSPLHAEIVVGSSGPRLKDLSHGGTGCRVNGSLVKRTFLQTGDEIAIGPFRLVFDGDLLQRRALARGLRLRAERVSFAAGDKTILQPVSLAVEPGELVAIIGESGAGKTTLLRLLCGERQPAAGRVLVDGEPVASRLADIGYVPQDEIVHSLLTVREALGFAAELRLPQDATAADRERAVAGVVAEVGLADHVDTYVGSLSGGQRKRAGVATELISQPGLLCLDEPTTGLDPGLEQRMMELFRSLADAGRPVLLVTHATRNLRLCDRVVVMGRGGMLAFDGTPDDALEFFGVEHFDSVYGALDRDGAEAWHARFAADRGADEPASPPVLDEVTRARPPRLAGPQASTLTRRYATLFLRDRRNLAILAGQVPLLALATGLLFGSDVFRHDDPLRMSAGESAQLLFLLATIALWFGAIAAAREIVKERMVVARELAIGVRPMAYLASKAAVLFTLTGLQTIVLALIVLRLRPLHEGGSTAVTVVAILVATAWVGAAMGLLVSVNVRSQDQAASFIPLLLVPQLLFGGAIVPTEQMGGAMAFLSKAFAAQWSFAGAGTAIDLEQRIGQDAVFSEASRYGAGFFDLSLAPTLAILFVFLGVFGFAIHHRLEALTGSRRQAAHAAPARAR